MVGVLVPKHLNSVNVGALFCKLHTLFAAAISCVAFTAE